MRGENMRGMSRRSFLAGAAATGALAAMGTLSGCAEGSAAGAEEEGVLWDSEADVVVVGAGFAGVVSALESAHQGLSVVVLEKAPEEHAGGNSRVCGQALWCPHDLEAATAYFKSLATEFHLTDLSDEVIEAYLSRCADNPEWVQEFTDIEIVYNTSIEYKNAGYTEKDERATNKEGKGDGSIWKPLFAAMRENENITVLFETPLVDLVFGDSGEAVGVKAGTQETPQTIKAKKGIVLACGGFEYNEAMIANYLRDAPLAIGSPYNTGDGHQICMKYDIDFWHMNSGTQCKSFGTLVPWAEEGFEKVAVDYGISVPNWIWTDKYGKRFVEEDTTSMHGHRLLDTVCYKDAVNLEQPRNPFWQICDQSAFGQCGVTITTWQPQVGGFEYSEDFSKEIDAGLCFKCDTVDDLAIAMKVDVETIRETLDSWNSYVQNGEDLEFGRAPEAMGAIEPPYYAMQLQPYMINTDGGPKRNEDANIVRTDGTPIPRLYSAGEFGSIWANWYQGGGNVAECFSFGRIAAENIAKLDPWDAK